MREWNHKKNMIPGSPDVLLTRVIRLFFTILSLPARRHIESTAESLSTTSFAHPGSSLYTRYDTTAHHGRLVFDYKW